MPKRRKNRIKKGMNPPPTPLNLKKLNKAFSEIMATPAGKEPSMYPSIRNIFVGVLGHDARDVLTDSRTEAGVRPDVSIAGRLENGMALANWVVVEAKDEDVFSDDGKADRIMRGKWRYVTASTEWFVCIDPVVIRIRRVGRVEVPEQEQPDVVFNLKGDPDPELIDLLMQMRAEKVKDRKRLEEFRRGAAGTFGRIDIHGEVPRRLFLEALNEAARQLSSGVKSALLSIQEERLAVRADWKDFRQKYPKVEMKTSPFKVVGVGSVVAQVRTEFREHVTRMREHWRKTPVAFTIETQLWEKYEARSEEEAEADELMIEETAALLLSRILMLRFFEDFGYFGDRRYLCNGGVAAFQNMREYFEEKYPAWLRQAYEAGSRIYHSVFDVSPLDWILNSRNQVFSTSIEQAMLFLSVFNFKTIEEELLSAIYGTFFNDRQRKAKGEHYTPPSIARWIVRRIKSKTGRLLDPACGFGTFLVEAYLEMVAKLLKKGSIELPEAEEMTGNVCGNDWNSFSGAISQMQMLWNLLNAPGSSLDRPLPRLSVSSGFDSLEPPSLFSHSDEMDVTPWSDLDQAKYTMVAGNPPYVRPERRDTPPTAEQQEYFLPVGAKSNLYILFIFKALEQWLETDGKLGFIIPLTFVDTEDSEKLRAMFRPGGKWRILEIVDMEEIKRLAFPSANVRPIILIAQNHPAEEGDQVELRLVDRDNVKFTHEGENLDFELDNARSSKVPYEQIWSKDGRILTRITAERGPIAHRLAALPTFESIAHKYFDLVKGNRIIQREFTAGKPVVDCRWVEKRFLLRGAVARGKDASSPNGQNLYKGENLLTCQLVGDAIQKVDPTKFSDPALWKFPDRLPAVGIAFSRISTFPTGVEFNPKEIVFLDTATLFFPDPKYAKVPFDFLVTSNVYRWFYVVYLRQGVIADFFSQAYPGAIGDLPWDDSFVSKAKELKSLRGDFLKACRELAKGKLVLAEKLAAIGIETLKARVETQDHLKLRWGGIEHASDENENFFRVNYGGELTDFVEVNDMGTAAQLKIAVRVFVEDSSTRDTIRNLPLPKAGKEEEYTAAIEEFETSNPAEKVRNAIRDLDDIVAPALGVSPEDLTFIQNDLAKDGLFSKLVFRLPFQEKTIRGILENLASSDRYTRL
jgi:hypothetical protein